MASPPKFCSSCGVELKPESRFCSSCGVAVHSQARGAEEEVAPSNKTEKFDNLDFLPNHAPQTMGFVAATEYGLRNFYKFSGRASRSQHWYFLLGAFVLLFLGGSANRLIAASTTNEVVAIIPALVNLVLFLVVFVGAIASWIRRLHDINRPGAWIFISFVPIVGPIVLLVFGCMPGNGSANRFGPGLKLLT